VKIDEYREACLEVARACQRLLALISESENGSSGVQICTELDIAIDRDRVHVTRHGRDVALTPSEYEVLDLLMRDPERTVRLSELARRLYGPQAEIYMPRVRAHVWRLRRKLGKDCIGVMPRVGYRLIPSAIAKVPHV
jgi:two-component system, OmpR family, KDP operon response regulator KdpE